MEAVPLLETVTIMPDVDFDQVRDLVSRPVFQARVWLIGAGVPHAMAMAMPDVEAAAMMILMGEQQGGRFDFDSRTWSPATLA